MKFEQTPQTSNQELEPKKELGYFEDSIKKLPEILAYIAALTGSTGVAFAEEVKANQFESGVQIEKNLEVDNMSRDRFGVSIYDQCEKSGCQVIVEKPSTNGKYIIHIAQVHTASPRDNIGYEMDIAKSQTVIYNLVTSLDNPTVIQEGETRTNISSIYKKETFAEGFDSRYKFAKNTIGSGTDNEMHIGLREEINYQIHRRAIVDLRYPALSELYSGEARERSLEENGKKIISDPQYRAEVISTVGESAAKSIEYFTKNKPIHFEYRIPFGNIQTRTVFALGAARMLLIDGKQMAYIKGDTSELLRKGSNFISSGRMSSPEFNDLLSERNKFALSMAEESGDSMPLIIYGAAHVFTPDLNESQSEYGVVRIKTGVSELHELYKSTKTSGDAFINEFNESFKVTKIHSVKENK